MIVPRDKATGLTSVVRKVACGAAEVVPLIQVTNLARTPARTAGARRLDRRDRRRGGSRPLSGETHRPLALVMGAEGKGMRRLTASTATSW